MADLRAEGNWKAFPHNSDGALPHARLECILLVIENFGIEKSASRRYSRHLGFCPDEGAVGAVDLFAGRAEPLLCSDSPGNVKDSSQQNQQFQGQKGTR